MNTRIPIAVVLLAGLGAVMASGEEPAKRPEWDQKKAVQKVKDLIALEEKGEFPWDKIAWQTDPAKASALAQKEQKPIFVYFFLKRNVGPAAAPC
jgi:hypothetical protein